MGTNNKVTNALSQVSQCLDKQTVTKLLDWVRNSSAPCAKTDNPHMLKEHNRMMWEAIIQAHNMASSKQTYWNIADTNWVVAQQNDVMLRHVMEWLK